MADQEVTNTSDDFSAGFSEEAGGLDLDFSNEASTPANVNDFPTAEEDAAAEAAEKVAPAPEPEVTPEPEAPKVPERDRVADIVDLLDKRLPKSEPKPEAAEQAPEEPPLTEAEQARLKELTENWTEVNELFQIQAKAQAQSLAKEVAKQFEAMRQEMEDRLKPVQENVSQSAQDRYDAKVREVHPEFFDNKQKKVVEDKLVAWVKDQPEVFRNAYVQALNSPNPQHAIDVLTRFKQETGTGTAKEVEPLKAAEPETSKKADSTKQDRLRRLEQPVSRRTDVTDATDPSDYEGGFKEMARLFDKTG